MSEVSDFFNMVSSRVDPTKIAGMNATYQFDITGEGGGKYAVKIGNGQGEVVEGEVENPSITLTMDAANFIALVTGKLNGQTAFLTGKLKIKGDMTLAMKLQSVFALGS